MKIIIGDIVGVVSHDGEPFKKARKVTLVRNGVATLDDPQSTLRYETEIIRVFEDQYQGDEVMMRAWIFWSDTQAKINAQILTRDVAVINKIKDGP